MDFVIVLYIAILALGLLLFIKEVFPLEISALLILILLVLSGIVNYREAFQNFGNDSIILIGSLFVLIAGLKRTGLIRKIEDALLKLGGKSKLASLTLLLFLVAFVSAFVSNTATLAVTIPVAVSMAKSHGEPPRTWLLPLAFVSVLGGMNSLVGTSTNIIISNMLPEYGLSGFHLFTTAYVGLPLLAVGLVYILLTRNWLLGQKNDSSSEQIEVKYNLRSYTAEVLVLDSSPLCNKTLEQSPLFRESETIVLGVTRAEEPMLYPRASFIVRSGDRLLVEGNIEKLTELTDRFGLKFLEQAKISDENSAESSKTSLQLELHEVLVSGSSLLNNRTASEVYLRNRYRISLIAVNRQGVTLHDKLSKVRILAGDILVVQFLAPIDNTILEFLGLIPLQKLKQERYQIHNAPMAAAIFILSLALGSLTDIPLALTCLTGSVLLVMLKIIRIDEVYETVQWRVLIFIAAILTLGKGMSTSGAADFLAAGISSLFANLGPNYALGFFITTTVALTSLLSNQATAVIMLPLALSTAQTLNLNAMPFVLAVTIGSSCCFITPFEPVFMLVYGAGEYSFKDFIRFGLVLNLVCILLATLLIGSIWPF